MPAMAGLITASDRSRDCWEIEQDSAKTAINSIDRSPEQVTVLIKFISRDHVSDAYIHKRGDWFLNFKSCVTHAWPLTCCRAVKQIALRP